MRAALSTRWSQGAEPHPLPVLKGPALALLELSQLFAQQMWVHDTPLLQLPHLSEKALRFLSNKCHVKSVDRLLSLRRRDTDAALGDLAPAQRDHVLAVAKLVPSVELSHSLEVEGEEDQAIYEGDVVCLQVRLTRRQLSLPVEEDDAPGAGDAAAAGADSDAASAAAAAAARLAAAAKEEEEEKDDDPLNLSWASAKPRLRRDQKVEAVAHAPRFPFPKKEVWHIMLHAKDPPLPARPHVLFMETVSTLTDSEELEIRIRAPDNVDDEDDENARHHDKVVRRYELHATCDAYRGCDQAKEVRLVVLKRRDDAEGDGEGDGDAEKDGEGEGGEEKEEEGKWYFLYCSSLGELLVTLAALAVAGVLGFNMLSARGWDVVLFRMLGNAWSRTGGSLAPLVGDALRPLLPGWLVGA